MSIEEIRALWERAGSGGWDYLTPEETALRDLLRGYDDAVGALTLAEEVVRLANEQRDGQQQRAEAAEAQEKHMHGMLHKLMDALDEPNCHMRAMERVQELLAAEAERNAARAEVATCREQFGRWREEMQAERDQERIVTESWRVAHKKQEEHCLKLMDERDQLRAEVERLQAEVERLRMAHRTCATCDHPTMMCFCKPSEGMAVAPTDCCDMWEAFNDEP